jgi:hypothetical protein
VGSGLQEAEPSLYKVTTARQVAAVCAAGACIKWTIVHAVVLHMLAAYERY